MLDCSEAQQPSRGKMSSDGQDSGTTFEQQVRTYLKILKQDPRSRVFAPLAALLNQAGHHREAEKVCRRGLAGNPDFADGHSILAEILLSQGRLAEALRAVERALQLNPESAESQALAAEILHSLGQDQRAVECCMHALDISPRNGRARRLLKNMQAGVAAAPEKKTTGAFRAVAPTAPGRRSGPADLLAENLAGLGREAIEQVDTAPQPFAALSAGSQPGDDFEVPTAPAKPSGRRRQESRRPDTPALPPHPPLPEPAEAGSVQAVGAAGAPAAASPVRAPAAAPVSLAGVVTGQLPLVHLVAAVVERVGYAGEPAAPDDVPLRIRRSGRLAVVAGVLAFTAVLAWLLVMAARRSSQPRPGGTTPAGAAEPAPGTVAGPAGSPPRPEPAPVAEVERRPAVAVPSPEAVPGKEPALRPEKAQKRKKRHRLKAGKKSRRRRSARRGKSRRSRRR